MLHSLEPILNHNCYKMQDILKSVVDAAVDGIEFGKECFPIALQDYCDDDWENNDEFMQSLYIELYDNICNLDNKETFRRQFLNNNNIQGLCNNITIGLENNMNWVENKTLKDFFLVCYSKLDLVRFRIEDENINPRKEYDNLFRAKNNYVCPFCGLNKYPNINAIQRADFDHYIHKGDYPLAAANMANLIPMCTECNRDIKKAKNILLDGRTRTYAFYPYDDIPEINFKVVCNREPLSNDMADKGEWTINITPSTQNIVVEAKIKTWDRVFNIKQRYVDDIKEFHDDWLLTILANRMERFDNIALLKTFFLDKSLELESPVQRKMQPQVYIKMIFLKFMGEHASDRFVNRYFQSHNNRVGPP